MKAMRAMISATYLVLVLGFSTLLIAAGPKGTAPRTSASRYPAHAEREGVAVGALLITPDQARRAFASDVSRCCVVVEVAVYPGKEKAPDITLSDFVLRVAGTDIAVKPASAKTLAAMLQKAARSRRDVVVSPSFGVGYESGARGIDPATGERRGGGVYTSAGVGVGVGNSGAQPASTDKDRETMESELDEKGLPEGTVSAAVAGYLYFPLASAKKKNAHHLLEYTVRGNKKVLQLP